VVQVPAVIPLAEQRRVEPVYLLELVRYIHLNPLRAKLVESMAELDRFEFCGHGVILGKLQKDWQDVGKLLGMFGKRGGNNGDV
jgi:hypothetical protein